MVSKAEVIALLKVCILHDQTHCSFKVVVDVTHEHLLSQLLTTLAEGDDPVDRSTLVGSLSVEADGDSYLGLSHTHERSI